jgi:hypothetical protein
MVLKIKINSDIIPKHQQTDHSNADSLCFLGDMNGVFIFYLAKLRKTPLDKDFWL